MDNNFITHFSGDAAEREARFEREKALQQKLLSRRYKRIERSIATLTEALKACLAWEETHHLAELLQANLYRVEKGMKTLEVEDWLTNTSRTLPLVPPLPPHKQVDALFRKARKLKRGIEHMQRQLALKEQERAELNKRMEILASISQEEELKVLFTSSDKFNSLQKTAAPTKKQKEEEARTPYRRYLSTKGLEIWVGKTAKDNDRLTFHYANGSDWWLHVSERPGSHVVIKTRKGEAPDPQTLQEACQLAIAHSKAKGEGGAEVVITQQKYLKKAKGGPAGKVYLSKHQKRWVEFNAEIINLLKS